ncbi:hypothetical protein QQ045_016540 [Rhodiola kirilowii]
MQKVKGYINEMAIRLEDEDERISNLVKLFFHEFSKKGLASRLPRPENLVKFAESYMYKVSRDCQSSNVMQQVMPSEQPVD